MTGSRLLLPTSSDLEDTFLVPAGFDQGNDQLQPASAVAGSNKRTAACKTSVHNHHQLVSETNLSDKTACVLNQLNSRDLHVDADWCNPQKANSTLQPSADCARLLRACNMVGMPPMVHPVPQ